MTFREKFWSVFLSGITAGGVSYGTAVNTAPPQVNVQSRIVVPVASDADANSRSFQRRLAASWGELDQKEIDALTAEFKKLEHRSVVVFCASDEKCGDMALDFVNAFGSAHWDFDQEVPLIDRTIGIGVSDRDVLAAIQRAAPRLPVGLIEASLPGRIALAIGKKTDSAKSDKK